MQTAASQTQNAPSPPKIEMQTSHEPPQGKDFPPEEPPREEQGDISSADPRDPGVSDEVWECLQLDKHAAATREKHYHKLLVRQVEFEAEHTREQEEERRLREGGLLHRHAATEEAGARCSAVEEDEAKRRFEQERSQRESERRRRQEELARLERERKKEEAAQRKLRTLGVCVTGFRWTKQAGGYRCAGGSYYVSDAPLGLG